MLLFVTLLAAAASTQPVGDMPVINPKADQPATCPATSRYEASKRGKAPKAQKLNELPVPKTVDAPITSMPREAKIVIDIALIALFGLQHSVMARPAFKAAWTRAVPVTIERSVYVLFASVALIVLYLFWQPLGRTVW